MGYFNKKDFATFDTETHEGADAFTRDPVEAWINMLFSCFGQDRFYETGSIQMKRFLELTQEVADKYGYTFIAKGAIFARNELGMRTISQIVAAWLNDKSFEVKRNFYRTFMHRPDDPAEIFAAVDTLNQKRTHALIRGTADYLSSLGEYSLMKYRMLGHQYNMYDIINLTHPKSAAINKFMQGKLETADTWESSISNSNLSEDERKEEWRRLVQDYKLGYMALIRNLNNILDSDVSQRWIDDYLIPQITDATAIRKSLIFPFRFYTAYRNLCTKNTQVILAMEEAFKLSVQNAPYFAGKNAVVLDVSGSMEDHISPRSVITLKEIGAVFAEILRLQGSDIDFIKFGTNAKRVKIAQNTSPFYAIKCLSNNDSCGYGTDIIPAMKIMHNDYDRIFVISDMQIFGNNNYWYYSNPSKQWAKKYGNVRTYSFDLGNYRNQFIEPKKNMTYLTSLNDSLFKMLEVIDFSTDNIVDIINNYIAL